MTDSSRRVLLVEPSQDERGRLADVLAVGDLEVLACSSRDEAEQALAAWPPGLTLARWNVAPVLSRADSDEGPGSGRVALILYGGPPTEEDRIAAFERGALAVLDPLPGDVELLARVRAALALHAKLESLERQAYRDGLTGLINRAALDDQLRRHIESSRRHGTSLSVLVIDLDRLKSINDTHGHTAGDEALRRASAVIAGSVRGGDLVARYGGDEFVVVAPGCPPESALGLAARFRHRLEAAADFPDGRLRGMLLTLSIGIAGTDGQTPARLDDLLDQADQALYMAKRSGGDAMAIYEPDRGGPILVPA